MTSSMTRNIVENNMNSYDYFTQLNNFIENASFLYPNKIAIICGNDHLTYNQLDCYANQFANYLFFLGLHPGDRIVVSAGNRLESVIAFWGTLKFGAIISVISINTLPNKIDYILQDSGAKLYVCTDKQFKSLRENILKFRYSLRKILLVDMDKETVLPSEAILFSEAIQAASSAPVTSHALDIDIASIIYTSGSTGEPKGVMMSHRNMLTAATSVNQYLNHADGDIIASVLPISFDYGLYQIIMSCSVGATLILEFNFIWPTQLLKVIARHAVTGLPIVPTMVPILAEHLKKFPYDVSSVRYITSTGSYLSVKHIDLLKELFRYATIYSMYGLTECMRCTYLPPSMLDLKPNSVGVAIPNTELRIVNESGDCIAADQVGQLVIRGATVMLGYWNKKSLTQEKLKPDPITGVNELYTGDYCHLDDDGFLYFHGRMDEVLKCRGIKVIPKEIEAYYMQHPAVREVAVLGVDDAELGTVIHIFFSTNDSISQDELRRYGKKGLSTEQQPKYITIFNSLPKTSNGKIDKLSLKNIRNMK